MRRVTFSLLLLAILAGPSATARADSFSFSIGAFHGHPHRHCYGPAWGFSYWAPPPPRYIYVAPPVVQERIYVQPPVVQQPVIIQQSAPQASTAAPANVASSLPSPPMRSASGTAPVVIRNANGRGAPVAFLLDDRTEELRDGQSRSYSGSSHVIEFDRGGNLGTARYELTGGMYDFEVGAGGWDLVRDSAPSRTAERPALKRNELPGDLKSR